MTRRYPPNLKRPKPGQVDWRKLAEPKPYVPSWCYDNNAPRMCMCGCHEGFHNDAGRCLKLGTCGCERFVEVVKG